LDKLKDKYLGSTEGVNVRQASKKLEWFTEQAGDITKGIKDPKTQVTVKFIAEDPKDLPIPLDSSVPDDRILSVCMQLKEEFPKKKVILVTNDILFGLKAAMYKISTSKYQQNLLKFSDYLGYRSEPINETTKLTVNSIYTNKKEGVKVRKTLKLQENEYCIVKGSGSARCRHNDGRIYPIDTNIRAGKIKPLNNPQAYAIDLLMDPDVKLVTLTGKAGSGKTLLSIACGLEQVLHSGVYKKLIVSRSLTVMGGKDKLGFLPGDLKSKLDPYVMPLKDAIDFVMGDENQVLEHLSDVSNPKVKPLIEIEPLQYIRGRNIRNAFMVVDEAQNLTVQDVKTIVTRIGEDSKIILLGDIDQIDNFYLSRTSNGLSQTIEKFKDSKLAGHIQLLDGVRSTIATEAADRL
jgi:PhoH-like ATPase